MKECLARFSVSKRRVLLPVFLALALVCSLFITKTRINYDLTVYLDSSTMTRRALDVMNAEFGSSEQIRVMFTDLPEETLNDCMDALNALPDVLLASHDTESGTVEKDGVLYQLVTVTVNGDATQLVQDIRGLFPDLDYAVGGSSASALDVQNSVGNEMPLALGIAVLVILGVLLLTSRAWLEPVIILITLLVSVLINMGTNLIFPQISFVTFAVCAILQLALSIDYAIMLLHAYQSQCDEGIDHAEAMKCALISCAMPLCSSAFTTIAGLLALLFMSFTIGFDIGLTLSKGILISLATVFFFMPALTLAMDRALRASRHRPIPLGGEKLGKGIVKGHRVLAAGLILVVAAGAVLQSKNTYIFSDSGRSTAQTESKRISDVFGSSDPLVLLIPTGTADSDYAVQSELAGRIAQITVNGTPAVSEVSAMVTTGAAALTYYSAEEIASMASLPTWTVQLFLSANGLTDPVRADVLLEKADALASGNEMVASLQSLLRSAREAFEGAHYSRMLITTPLSVHDSGMREMIDSIMSLAREYYGDDFYLTGNGMSVYDIGNAFEGDLTKVNLITLLAILLIVALSFRSLLLPVLLVFVIEGAIWLSMAVSYIKGEPIFFISYLICVAIQMGATIDYAILETNLYRGFRKTLPAPDAICKALHGALPTLMTSGLILVCAGFVIGKVCSIYYISSIGLLLARGAFLSLVMVLTLLPALLLLCDKMIKPGKSSPASKA